MPAHRDPRPPHEMTDAQIAAELRTLNPWGGYTAAVVRANRFGMEKTLAMYRIDQQEETNASHP